MDARNDNALDLLCGLESGSGGHALEAGSVGSVHLWDGDAQLGEGGDELRRVELAVGSASLDDEGLLREGEVLSRKVGLDVLLVQLEHLVVRDRARVGKVVHSREVVLCHRDRRRQQVVQQCVGVGNVDDSLVSEAKREPSVVCLRTSFRHPTHFVIFVTKLRECSSSETGILNRKLSTLG